MSQECSICKAEIARLLKIIARMKDVFNCRHGSVGVDGDPECDHPNKSMFCPTCRDCQEWEPKK
jgi:hypothetical protein